MCRRDTYVTRVRVLYSWDDKMMRFGTDELLFY